MTTEAACLGLILCLSLQAMADPREARSYRVRVLPQFPIEGCWEVGGQPVPVAIDATHRVLLSCRLQRGPDLLIQYFLWDEDQGLTTMDAWVGRKLMTPFADFSVFGTLVLNRHGEVASHVLVPGTERYEGFFFSPRTGYVVIQPGIADPLKVVPTAMNDLGEVVGLVWDASDAIHGFHWSPEAGGNLLEVLPGFGEDAYVWPRSLDNQGTWAGGIYPFLEGTPSYGVIGDHRGASRIVAPEGAPGGQFVDYLDRVTEDGQVIATCGGPSQWDPSVPCRGSTGSAQLELLTGGSEEAGSILGTNELGWAVGLIDSSQPMPFLYDGETFHWAQGLISAPDYPGFQVRWIQAVNDRGVVVGNASADGAPEQGFTFIGYPED
jgi:hypothetical protein